MNSLLCILFPKNNSPWGIHHGEFPMGNSPSGIPQRIPMENSPRWIHHGEFTVNLIPRAFFVNSPICLGQRIRFPKGNSPWRILLWWIHVNIPGEFPASFKWTVLYVMLCLCLCLCYVMLCYVMLCYVMLCYVMLCYVMLCYVMLCYVMLCYVMLCYVMLCYAMSCYAKTLCYVMARCLQGTISTKPEKCDFILYKPRL